MEQNMKKEPLTVRNLNLSIEGRPILKNINLTFPENKITCIVGPSGCGKSTLLKTLNRLIDNVDDVEIDGQIMIGSQNIIVEAPCGASASASVSASDVHI